MPKKKKKKPTIIAAGGTAGHMHPATHFAKQSEEAFFMGHGLSDNPHFDGETFDHLNVMSSSTLRNPLRLVKGIIKATVHFLKHPIDRVVGFGSYHSFPTLCAARFLKRKIELYESNILPGRMTRHFLKTAQTVYLHFPEQVIDSPHRHYLPLEWGIRGLEYLSRDRQELRKMLGLDPDMTTILVFGGSLGAKKLNEVFLQALGEITEDLQVIHITGRVALHDSYITAYRRLGIPYVLKSYEKDMGLLQAAADIALSRAGAMTLREAICFDLPSIMVPFPLASENHQWHNAVFFQTRVKGGIVIPDRDLTPSLLAEKVEEIIRSKQQYIHAIQTYKKSVKSE